MRLHTSITAWSRSLLFWDAVWVMGQAVQVGNNIFSNNISNQETPYATQHPRSPKTRTTGLSIESTLHHVYSKYGQITCKINDEDGSLFTVILLHV